MYITFIRPSADKYYSAPKENSKEVEFNVEAYFNNPTAYMQSNPILQNFDFNLENAKLTIEKAMEELQNFYDSRFSLKWKDIPAPPNFPIEELGQHYHQFFIPKKSGGLRQIDAPDDILKIYLSNLASYLGNTLSILPHNAAHAYVHGRSTITALKVHQRTNKQKWFLKLDFHAFFPSHTLDYVMKTLERIYPIGFLMQDQSYSDSLRNCLKYAFLPDGTLPQGTPLSPLLTNICMVGLDHDIQNMLYNEIKSGCVYTRYADDLLISSPYRIDFKDVEQRIIDIINTHNAPFSINTKKTRFGSNAGRNWNLGLMLNKDNNITIGHKNAQRFRAALNTIFNDYVRGVRWSSEDRMRLNGLISYYKAIEPEYINFVIKKYEDKYNLKIKTVLEIKVEETPKYIQAENPFDIKDESLPF